MKGLYSCYVLLLVLLLPGCAVIDRDYLKVSRNFEVEKLFRQGIMLPEYNYFYYGPEAEPIALLALEKKYTLHSEFWTPCDDNDSRFEYWISEFNRLWGQMDDWAWVRIDYEGMDLYLQSGERVGMAYTRYYWMTAWRAEDGSLVIPPPEPSGVQAAPGIRRWAD